MNEKQRDYLLILALVSILILYGLVASIERQVTFSNTAESAQSAGFWNDFLIFFSSGKGRGGSSKYDIAPGDYEYTIRHDGLKRYYDVHIPQSYKPNEKTPVLMYLHGGAGNGSVAAQELGPYAEKYGFILVGPYGTNGNKWFPKQFLVWNAGEYTIPDGSTESCCGYASENNIDDVGFLNAMINDLSKKANVDEKRIYATGISNGAGMSYRLACELRDKIAAIAPVAGRGPDTCNGVEVPVMIIHGLDDPITSYDGGQTFDLFNTGITYYVRPTEEFVEYWKGNNHCADQTITTYQNGGATCLAYQSCTSSLTFCPIDNMGHTWPSGGQYLPESLVGSVSFDMSFDQMWEFLSSKRN